MVRTFILIISILSLFFLLIIWGEGMKESTERMDISRLADQFILHAKKGERAPLAETLSAMRQRFLSYPSYLYPNGWIPQDLTILLESVERKVWLNQMGTDRFAEESLILYYLMDAVAHPYQPLWLEVIKSWEEKKGVSLKEYALIRPAMRAVLSPATIARFDRYFSLPNEERRGEFLRLLAGASEEAQTREVRNTKDLLLTLYLFLLIILFYIALRMKVKDGNVPEGGSYWHLG